MSAPVGIQADKVGKCRFIAIVFFGRRRLNLAYPVYTHTH